MWRCWAAGIVVGLALAGDARAGTAQIEVYDPHDGCGARDTISYVAGPGEVNRVTLTASDGDLQPLVWETVIGCGPDIHQTVGYVSDPLGVTPGAGCRAVDVSHVACVPGDGNWFGSPRIELGDGDDYLFLTSAFVAETPGAGGLQGGPWSVVVQAGPGDDTLRTTNGAADEVDCGDGVDSVVADAADRLTGCEHVTAPPA